MKSLIVITAGIGATLLGLLGLLIPVIPGILFLLVAAICFASVSPEVRQQLQRFPRFRRLMTRVDSGRGMQLMMRCRLVFWALLEAVNPRTRV